MIKYLLIMALFWGNLAFSENTTPSEKTAVSEKESNQLLDPFNRGVSRPTQFDSNRIEDDVYSNQRFDDMRSLNDHRYYRVSSLNATNTFDVALNDTTGKDSQTTFNAYFIALKTDPDKKNLLQYGQKIMLGYRDLLARDLSIKFSTHSAEDFTLTYGPFKTRHLALAHCHFFTYATNAKDINCNQVLVEQSANPDTINIPSPEANLGLSQAGILFFSKSEMGFNVEDLINMNLAVSQDQPLGPKGYWVTKINNFGVYVASVYGDIALIPMNSIPVNDPMNLNSQEPASEPSPAASENKSSSSSKKGPAESARERLKEKIMADKNAR